jgi:transposase
MLCAWSSQLLKKSPWLLFKREENLKEEQRFRLRDLLRYNLKTVRAYLLRRPSNWAPELALYHSFGKLPEQVSTHDFF